MSGLAKSADSVVATVAPVHQTTQGISKPETVIHPEVYRYFGVDRSLNSGDEKLKFIASVTEGKSPAESLSYIKSLERKLGTQMADSSSRLDKLYNWMRMNESVKGHSSEMRQNLNVVSEKFKVRINELRNAKSERVAKISEEIDKIEASHRDAVNHLKINWSNESRSLKDKYESQIKELKSMRKVYGG